MRTHCGVLLCCMVVAAGGGAVAQPTDPAAKAFARGGELFEKRDYLGALEAFEEAYRLKPHYVVQCNIARCHEWSGDMLKAKEHYKRCLDEGADKAEVAAAVRKSLAEVERRITWVTVASPGGGGTIHVDGKAVGQAPGRIPLNPGTRVIEVRREGAKPAAITIKTRGGEERTVTLIPVAREISPATQPATQPATPGHSRRTLRQHWFWISAAATVVLAATTIGLGVATLKSRDKYVDETRTEDDYNTAVNQRLATNVLLGLTVAAAATSTTLFFFTDFKGRRAEEPRAEPRTDVTLGVGLRGSF